MESQQKHGSLQNAALTDKKRKTNPENTGIKQKKYNHKPPLDHTESVSCLCVRPLSVAPFTGFPIFSFHRRDESQNHPSGIDSIRQKMNHPSDSTGIDSSENDKPPE